jgi:hypothetical protein
VAWFATSLLSTDSSTGEASTPGDALRTREGDEFGIGPNVTPAGTALVLAAGMTFRTGAVNIPVNVAVVPSKVGSRVTLLSGLSLRRR